MVAQCAISGGTDFPGNRIGANVSFFDEVRDGNT
jgi:hypothetical protein